MSEGGFCYITKKPLKSRSYKIRTQKMSSLFFIDYKKQNRLQNPDGGKKIIYIVVCMPSAGHGGT